MSGGRGKNELEFLFSRLLLLDSDLQSYVLSFGDAADLFLLMDASADQFTASVIGTFQMKANINLSFLLKMFPNTIERNQNGASPQQAAVAKILNLLLGENSDEIAPSSNRQAQNLKHLECASLRGISGRDWLPQLHLAPLETLDLSGCAALDPGLLIQFLQTCNAKTLLHLNLFDCSRVGPEVVDIIARHHIQLESLWLGRCSQTIRNPAVHNLLRRLRRLKHLDLQAMNNISDRSGQFMELLPDSIESLNISSCKHVLLAGMEALGGIQIHMNHLGNNDGGHWDTAPVPRHNKIMHIVLDAVGTPRVGLCRGMLAYFAMGRSLREVHLTGCEQVQDWEVEALARTCAGSLTCLQMRGCRIGDKSLKALANHCKILAEVDISACFRVSNVGVMDLCSARHFSTIGDQERKRGRASSKLRVLRIASLPGLNDLGAACIANVDSLHILDIQDCVEVSTSTLCETILQLPHLIDVNAKGIANGCGSLTTLLRSSGGRVPKGLRMVNQRLFSMEAVEASTGNNIDLQSQQQGTNMSCCSVRAKAQRLTASTPMAVMFHCLDCKLVPSLDRGVCACCVSKCHKGHNTYVGSWTRFYCDCPFGVAGNDCEAIFPESSLVSTGTGLEDTIK